MVMMVFGFNSWTFLLVLIRINNSDQNPDFDVNVSQNGGIDDPDCQARSFPCRTMSYALGKCKQNEERIGLCHLIINGGSKNSRYTYHIDAEKNVTISYIYRLSMEALDAKVKPIITCNSTKPNITCMNIEVTELTFSSIEFIGDSQTSRSIFNIKTEGPGFGSLVVSDSSFQDFDMTIRLSKGGSVTKSTFINTRIEKFTGESKPFIFKGGTVFCTSYLEGQFIDLEGVTLYNSSATMGGYVIEDSKFVGSYYEKEKEIFLPQLKIINNLNIQSSTFTDAFNGAIEIIDCRGYIVLNDLVFEGNHRSYYSDKSIVHFENAGTLEMHYCVFKNNYAQMRSGNNLYIASERSSIESTIQLSFITISNSYPDQYSLTKIKNITVNPDESWRFECEPNTQVQYVYQNKMFEYFCLPFTDTLYSTQKSILSWSNGSFYVQSALTFQCPEEAVWTFTGIKSTGNYWGYVTKNTGEIDFLRCPSTYCCQSREDCTSYDTCRNGRIGQLCGACPNRTRISMFDGLGCVPETSENCDNQIIWILISIDSVIVLLIITFSYEIFSVFGHLGHKRKSTRGKRQKMYRPLGNISDDQPVRQIEDSRNENGVSQRRQIEGGSQKFKEKTEYEDIPGQSLKVHPIDNSFGNASNNEDTNCAGNDIRIHNAHSAHNRPSNNDFTGLCQSQSNDDIPGNASYQNNFSEDFTSYNNTNEPPIKHNKAASTQAIIEIIFNFYQMTGLILLQTPIQSIKLLPTDILVSLFAFRLQLPSLPWNACPFQTRNPFLIELTKISPIMTAFLILLISLFAVTLYRYIKQTDREQEDNNIHQAINQHTEGYKKLPFALSLKCAYVKLLCFSHTSITLVSFQFLNRVTVDGENYHFIDATIKFTYNSQTIVASLLILLFWSMPLIFVIYLGTRWLERCQITPNQFLLIITLPPLAFCFWCYISRRKPNAQLNAQDAKIAKHLLDTTQQPYRYLNSDHYDKKTKLIGESLYLTSRFILAIACTFAVRPEDRIWSITTCLLMHLVCFYNVKPFQSKSLNTFEYTCTISLVLINMTSYMMQSSAVEHVVTGAITGTVVLSFAPFIMYVLVRLVDFIYESYIVRRTRE